MEFDDEIHNVFNTYVHNNGKRLTLLHRIPGLAIDNEMAITLEMSDDYNMTTKYKLNLAKIWHYTDDLVE